MPGVLAGLNHMLGSRDINVTAQSLATQDKLGYVVTDVAQVPDETSMQQLRAFKGAIRVRTLQGSASRKK